jgi:putative spermidine/putrescine transport system substrate-binding protein
VERTRSRIVAACAATALAVAVVSPSLAQTDAATATTAEDLGGMEALIAAAQAEGKLNVIALSPTWANYGQMIEDFSVKYGIEIDSAQPDANSQQEIDAVNQLAGTDAAPDVLDLGATVALANTDLFAPYMNAAWADIPDDLKEATGLWVSDYTGLMSIGCDVGRVTLPTTVADLLKPEYAGMVALNGNPTTAGAGFNGVVMASLANGGSADDIAPGVEFFNQLNEAGNLLPIDPTPATIASGQSPCVIDWEYTNAAQTDVLAGQIDWQVAIPSDAPPVAAYYVQAINKEAPHPAAARLWQEYIFSPEGQNTWLRGYARPVLQDKLVADGTIDQEAFDKLAPTSGAPVQLTQEQVAAAQEYLGANWSIVLEE